MTLFKLCAAVLLCMFSCFSFNKGFAQAPPCPPIPATTETSCTDGIDNDCDGFLDCDDSDCNTPTIGGVLVTSPTFCYSNNGRIEAVNLKADGGGGSGNPLEWQFRINNSAWQSSTVFNNLSPGTFTVIARNTVNGCESEYDGSPVDLLPGKPDGQPIINNIDVTEASFCTNNGNITIDANNPAPGGYLDLRYRLNGGAWSSSNTFNNLAGGNYTVEVATSDGRCSSSQMVTVPKLKAPVINSVSTTSSTSCSTPNGQIQINASQPDNLDLVYSIDNGVTWSGNALFTNLSPGTYTVAVAISGDESCKVTRTATLGGTSTINITNVSTTAATSCAAPDGRITISASGSGTLYYKIQGGTWQTSNIINGLVPGTYTVLVKNSNGTCEVTYPTPVQVSGTGVITINTVNTIAPTTCDTALANGQITITAQGGTGLRYSINNGLSFSTSNSFSNLKAGTYNVVVTKSDGSCAVSYPPVVVPSPTGITVQSVQTVRPTICGATNGSITITAAPAGTYQYSINGGQTFQSSATFSNLSQGSYQIVVKSATSACIAYHTANPVTLQPLSCPEICNDGIDNDGVGGVDNCPDATCGLTTPTVQLNQAQCNTNRTITVSTGHQTKDCSNLSPGDIVINKIEDDIADRFSFVTKVNLAGGTKIIFTDKGWKANGGFNSGEGIAEWTAPSGGVPAGTVVNIQRYYSFSGPSNSGSASSGTIVFDESVPGYANYGGLFPDFGISGSGDQLFAICGSSFATANLSQLKFLSGIYTNGTAWNTDATSSSTSAIPPGLSNGTTALAVGDVAAIDLGVPDVSIRYSIDGGQTFQKQVPVFLMYLLDGIFY